jgi:hypothetical protein
MIFFFSKPGFSLLFFSGPSCILGFGGCSSLPHVFIVLVYASLFVMIRIPCEHFQLIKTIGRRGVGLGQTRMLRHDMP